MLESGHLAPDGSCDRRSELRDMGDIGDIHESSERTSGQVGDGFGGGVCAVDDDVHPGDEEVHHGSEVALDELERSTPDPTDDVEHRLELVTDPGHDPSEEVYDRLNDLISNEADEVQELIDDEPDRGYHQCELRQDDRGEDDDRSTDQD